MVHPPKWRRAARGGGGGDHQEEEEEEEKEEEEENLFQLPAEFSRSLEALLPAGRFAAGGLAAGLPKPLLCVAGMDALLPWPCPPSTSAAAIQQAARAPYGRGAAAVVDADAWACWRIPTSDLSFGNTVTWPTALGALLDELRSLLGVGGPVGAALRDLLVYGAGGQFAAHTDTAAEEGGQLGTLEVKLPAAHDGGSLVVHHHGQSLTTAPEGVGAAATLAHLTWAAFYCDCQHQVTPVASGHRLALIYNLLREETAGKTGGAGGAAVRRVAAPDQAPAVAQLSALVARCSSARAKAVAAGTVQDRCEHHSEWHWCGARADQTPCGLEYDEEQHWQWVDGTEDADVVPDKSRSSASWIISTQTAATTGGPSRAATRRSSTRASASSSRPRAAATTRRRR